MPASFFQSSCFAVSTKAGSGLLYCLLPAFLSATLIPAAFGANRSLSSETSIDYTMHRLATEYNDPSAQYLVGRNYLKGKSVEKNVKEAIKWFEMAAKQNHIRAQYQLGKLYLYGKEIKTNLNFAFYFLSKAAEKNHLESQFELANFYLKGNANKRQYTKAAEWYRRAANRGHVRSMYELGKLLNEGLGIEQNREEARRYISDAAESGLLDAAKYLSKLDDLDEADESGRSASSLFANKSAAMEADTQSILTPGGTSASNETIDHYKLGIAYLTGDGKEKNIYEAAQHFEFAAHNGHGKAQYQLAKLYQQGIGVEQNHSLYQKWLRRAADAGVISALRDLETLKAKAINSTHKNDDPDSQYKMGVRHLSGDNLPKDPAKASQLFLKAAEQNHAKAQFQLGIMYDKAIGFDRNISKARHWYSKAASAGLSEARIALEKLNTPEKQNKSRTAVTIKANRKSEDPLQSELISKKSSPITPFIQKAREGDRSAQYELGIAYLSGKNGVDKDVAKGIDWLKTAANNHYTQAGTTLGLLYYEGEKVKRDYSMAARWLEKSAKDGDPQAQFILGTIYQRGLGVSKNNTTAIMWYRKAANQGHRGARKQLGGCRIC